MSHPTSAGAHSAPDSGAAYVVAFEHLRMTDVESVGGKNASLGEMISQLAHVGVRVPGGFATTAQAFRDFLSYRSGGGAAQGAASAAALGPSCSSNLEGEDKPIPPALARSLGRVGRESHTDSGAARGS